MLGVRRGFVALVAAGCIVAPALLASDFDSTARAIDARGTGVLSDSEGAHRKAIGSLRSEVSAVAEQKAQGKSTLKSHRAPFVDGILVAAALLGILLFAAVRVTWWSGRQHAALLHVRAVRGPPFAVLI